ncbi:H-2 class I histocompatibility antigen, Q9 alpha chain-like [Hemicordylus capensis]|uniref:H-2 class I histocompatibility antigen, Q9 alpha chain-like n=1 Tax=Hemicordylus capensis TaxID=884348 RepID=UPI0023030D79|nr:H-2 class I histocompatibility antigen, Q9 alpha chain-like [Hemicordylus capensis]
MEAAVLVKLCVLAVGPHSWLSPPPPPATCCFSHSLKYLFTSVLEPGQEVPKFTTVGYVDDQAFVHYDSSTSRRMSPVPWMKKVEEEFPQFWEKQTEVAEDLEEVYRINLAKAMYRYNHSGGSHILQCISACELDKDGHKSGTFQYTYDGRDFISLDKDALAWVAADSPALETTRNWESDPRIAQQLKFYLEVTCIEWLQKYLNYGKEVLLRTERRQRHGPYTATATSEQESPSSGRATEQASLSSATASNERLPALSEVNSVQYVARDAEAYHFENVPIKVIVTSPETAQRIRYQL